MGGSRNRSSGWSLTSPDRDGSCDRRGYFFFELEEELRPGVSRVIVPLPKGFVVLCEPSERWVSVPLPNLCVVPVIVLPFLSRSVVSVPLPNFSERVVDPSDHLVMVLEPNWCVVPVTVFPFLSRSVVIVPLPKGRVVLLEPSDRCVSVPDPNGCVVPVRGLLGGSIARATRGSSSTAKSQRVDIAFRCIGGRSQKSTTVSDQPPIRSREKQSFSLRHALQVI